MNDFTEIWRDLWGHWWVCRYHFDRSTAHWEAVVERIGL